MAKRGELTKAVIEAAQSYGLETLTREELRLIPYLQYCLTNDMRIDLQRINRQEVGILAAWQQDGHVVAGLSPGGRVLMSSDAPKLAVTQNFWNMMSHVLWLAYVNYEAQEVADAA